MKKGNTMQQFLQKALEILRKDFSELRSGCVALSVCAQECARMRVRVQRSVAALVAGTLSGGWCPWTTRVTGPQGGGRHAGHCAPERAELRWGAGFCSLARR